jgi:hypothetical protein
MADRALLRKQAVDGLIEREVEQIRKRHPGLDVGNCYSRLFSEQPWLYASYVEASSIVCRNGGEE